MGTTTMIRRRFALTGAVVAVMQATCSRGSDAPQGLGAKRAKALTEAAMTVSTPARAGSVDGTTENSDAFIWRLFTEFVAPSTAGRETPVVFEGWASDKDTFSSTPHWPTVGESISLQQSVLATMTTGGHDPPPNEITLTAVDEACLPPSGAAVGGFPISGAPTPCIAEQVARNRPQFDYIVNSGLNTRAGRAKAFSQNVKIEMPLDSIALKGDWIPLPAILAWVPEAGTIENLKKLYYTTTINKVEYGLVAMHVSSRQNPNWVWATFEHQMNPGRCDEIGCFDTFGAQVPEVLPNKNSINTQYGPCLKTEALKALMTKSHLAQVWDNYCLKSSQVDYASADGTPYVLGNSVIEGIVGNGTIAASSCIACHAYASFGADGQPTKTARSILPFNPTGKPIPAVLAGSQQFAFMWGVLQGP